MPIKRSYKYDPIEDSPEYLAIRQELEEKILAQLGGQLTRANAHRYAGLKKKILKEDYAMDWKSPQELNPRIKFN